MRSSSTMPVPPWIPAAPSATYPPPAPLPSASANSNLMTTTFIHPLTAFIEKTFVITEFELRKLRHDFTELITRALQPALWLLIFGQVFSRSGAMHTGNIPYLDFIAPGILAQSVLFVAIFYGINVIWERDLGIVQKFLASPTPRAALVLGKGFSAGIRTLSQGVIVYILSLLLGVKLNWSPLALLNVLIIVVLAATLFSTFALIHVHAVAAGMAALAVESLFFGLSADAEVLDTAAHWQFLGMVAMSFLPGFWLFFSLTFARGNYREFLARWRLVVAAAFIVPVILAQIGRAH